MPGPGALWRTSSETKSRGKMLKVPTRHKDREAKEVRKVKR